MSLIVISSPYPPRVFSSRLEENTAIEALLPLLNSRRQQLVVQFTMHLNH